MSCSGERRGLNQKRGMRKTERGKRWRRQKQGVRRLKSTAVDFKILKCFQGAKKPPGEGRLTRKGWIKRISYDFFLLRFVFIDFSFGGFILDSITERRSATLSKEFEVAQLSFIAL